MKEYSLQFGHFGNGISVCNRKETSHGDYRKVAHIDRNRQVKFYETLLKEVEEQILTFARTANPTISATQSQLVFANQVEA